METIEIYKCRECGAMNEEGRGGVSTNSCENCGSSDIQWYVACACADQAALDMARTSLESEVVRTSRDITELYQEVDGDMAMSARNTAIQETIDWLTDPTAARPEVDEGA